MSVQVSLYDIGIDVMDECDLNNKNALEYLPKKKKVRLH